MKINLRTEPKGSFREINVKRGTSLEEIYKSMADELPYLKVAARVGNKLADLTTCLYRSCDVELLDIRTQAANLIYQYSLSFVYLKAVKDIFGNTPVIIWKTMSKGLYTEFPEREISKEEVVKIEARMREIVKEDLPFVKREVSRATALKYCREDGMLERRRLIASAPQVERVSFYSMGGYRDFFYGYMVPSSGYVQYFKLRKYRDGVLIHLPYAAAPDRVARFDDEVKLYQAFREQREWDKLLGVMYVPELNEKIAAGQARELIQLSEALHEKKIAQFADTIKRRGKKLVLIAGPSSSGKTTFARRLCIQLMVNGLDPIYLGTDDYFVEREETPLDEHGEPDFENLEALDIDLFNSNMRDLLNGKKVDMPTFDFVSGHKIFGKRMTQMKEDQILVIEGIHALNDKLTSFIPAETKFRIYISPLTNLNIDEHNRIPATDERMLRRLVRDYQFRGYSAEHTLNTWPKVRTGEDKNIFPYSDYADVLFNSYHVYEISVLKKYAEPLLRAIKAHQPEYAEAQRMLQFLQFFRTIEDDSAIVNNSIMREFIGGSVFV